MKYLYIFILTAIIAACNQPTTNTASNNTETSTANLEGYELSNYEGRSGLQKAIKKDGENILEQGDVIDGQKAGSWITYNKGRYAKVPQWIVGYKDGKKHGASVKLSDRGEIAETAFYVNGLLEGTRTIFKNRKVEEETEYKNGKRNGTHKSYYNGVRVPKEDGKTETKDGIPKEEGNFVNGKRHGINKWYNDKGEVTIEYEYVNGKKKE